MKSYVFNTLNTLSANDDLACLRALRDSLSARSVGLFRQSKPTGDQFSPTLSVLGFQPSTLFQSRNGEVKVYSALGLNLASARDPASASTKSSTNSVEIFQPSLTSSNLKTTQTFTGDPFQIFSDLMEAHKVAPRANLPFFQGGALGYFGYDAVKFVEPRLQKSKQLRVNSDVFDAEIVFYKNYLLFDRTQSSVTLVSETAEDAEAARKILASLAFTPQCAFESVAELPLTSFQSLFGKEAFVESVKTLKTHIKDGDIFQAVLSERFQHEYLGDELDLFESLVSINPAPYQFYFEIDGRTFLGASPEMLVKSEGTHIETHPIAGTRPRGKNAEDERKNELQLRNSVKENAEHLMLVDLARNDIGRVASPGTVKVESFSQIRKFGSVMHLVSKVTGSLLPNTNGLQALRSCFPAGTLSGAPKIRAMDLLGNLELKPRGFYGGAFIAASITGELDSCITIRSMSIENKTVTVQAGAGIVADSSPEKEYEEIEHKSRLARRALACALNRVKTKAAI